MDHAVGLRSWLYMGGIDAGELGAELLFDRGQELLEAPGL